MFNLFENLDSSDFESSMFTFINTIVSKLAYKCVKFLNYVVIMNFSKVENNPYKRNSFLSLIPSLLKENFTYLKARDFKAYFTSHFNVYLISFIYSK